MFQFVLRKMISKKWMILALLIGNILLMAVASASSMYSNAVMQRALTQKMNQYMVENNAYCNDILIQSAAVNAAVNAFNRELIGSHLRGCVSRDLRAGNDDVIDELLSTLQKLMK